MNHAKAKKAKDMAEQALDLMILESEMAKAAESDLQPEDGYINPMGRIGVVRPTTYSLTNQLDGTTTQSVINPET
jgi:hypothetical protein